MSIPVNASAESSNMSSPQPTHLVCPFCGLVTSFPHESQEGCIQALQAEIDRIRHVLDQVRPVGVAQPVEDDHTR